MFDPVLLASLCEESEKNYELFSSWNLLEDYKGAVKEEIHAEHNLYAKVCLILYERDKTLKAAKAPRVAKYFFTRYVMCKTSTMESVVLWEHLVDNIKPIYISILQEFMTDKGFVDFMLLKNNRQDKEEHKS
ncbi:MAG: hypothetical protein [Drosophila North Esk phasmavirus]|nr:MAG: hypothetical protein [Drosophila North Esk phasmavirus]